MNKFIIILYTIVIFFSGILSSIFLNKFLPSKQTLLSPIGQNSIVVKERIFDKYSYESLRQRKWDFSPIVIENPLKQTNIFTSYQFSFKTEGNKTVSGLANIPKGLGPFPIIVMFRGFVDPEIFTSGEGTRRTAMEFARNGFATLAPDFLGYGISDNPSKNAMEERFQTYTTALSLLASIKNLNSALEEKGEGRIDAEKIGLWGHSNGGQIAVTILEITGKEYPTVLWAPVSKPFPYSILYFTDEFEDRGKALRKLIADFEKDYDVDKYSITSYLDWIKAPIQLHQGTADEAVPVEWSNEFAQLLRKKEIEVAYYTYPGENHNFNNSGQWLTAVKRSVVFYKEKL